MAKVPQHSDVPQAHPGTASWNAAFMRQWPDGPTSLPAKAGVPGAVSGYGHMPRRAGLWLVTVGLFFLASCATGPGGKGAASKYIFYPPPPAPPRLQFLASFSDSKDLGLHVSRFAEFVTGAAVPSQPIEKPYGVALCSNQIFVCDTTARCVKILDLTQQTMRQFAPSGLGKLGTPINIAIDTDGTRYVTDTGRNQVLCYGPDESLRAAIGENDAFRPTGVALTADRVYVADLSGHCVRVYEKTNFGLLFTIPRHPEAAEEMEPGKLYMPVNVAVDQQGRVYVSDLAACRIQIYEADGRYARSLGARGDLPGQFARPKGVAVDREGRIYVADAAAQVCQIFSPEGKLLLFFGEPNGSAASLELPAAVAVDYEHVGLFQKYAAPNFALENLVVITSQIGERKVSVYGLGHKK